MSESIDLLKQEISELTNDLSNSQKLIDLLEKYRNFLIDFKNNCNCNQNIGKNIIFNSLEIRYNLLKDYGKQKPISEQLIDNNEELNSGLIEDKNAKNIDQNVKNEVHSESVKSSTIMTRLRTFKANPVYNNVLQSAEDQSSDDLRPIDIKLLNSAVIDQKRNDKNILNKSKQRKNWSSKKRFTCLWPGCDAGFKTKLTLERHTDRHKGVKREVIPRKPKPKPDFYVCEWPECGFNSKMKKTVKCHYIRHTGVKNYDCHWPGCESRFYFKRELNAHIYLSHSDEKKFVCDFPNCGKAFKVNESLRHHKYIHSGGNPFHCQYPDCGKSYATKRRLEIHLETHSNVKNYICDHEFCGKAFKTKHSLLDHKKHMHSLSRTYVCDWAECAKRYETNESLERHVKAKHLAVRRFKCLFPDCGQAFADSSTLSKHTNRHFK